MHSPNPLSLDPVTPMTSTVSLQKAPNPTAHSRRAARTTEASAGLSVTRVKDTRSWGWGGGFLDLEFWAMRFGYEGEKARNPKGAQLIQKKFYS